MFNTLKLNEPCEVCGGAPIYGQFRYGNVNSNLYQIGDTIMWGATQIGEPFHHVLVAGVAKCSKCMDQWPIDIEIKNDVLVRASPHCDTLLFPDDTAEYRQLL